jgi:hypothetical protein
MNVKYVNDARCHERQKGIVLFLDKSEQLTGSVITNYRIETPLFSA